MAFSLVSAGTPASGTSPQTPSFGQTTTAGNLLVCLIAGGGNASTQTSGWSQTDSTGLIAIAYKIAVGGDAAPTAQANTSVAAVLLEFSGGATSSPVDQHTAAGGAGTVSPVTATNPGADVASGELLVTTGSSTLTKAGTVTTSNSLNNGATTNDVGNNDATSTTVHFRFSWGTTTSNSAADANTYSDNSMNLNDIVTGIASFRLAVAATAIASALTPSVAIAAGNKENVALAGDMT